MWAVSKSLRLPFDIEISDVNELPYTISYVIRKRSQVDSFRELPKEKRPTEKMIWDGTSEEVEDWFDDIFKRDRSSKSRNRNDGLVLELDKRLIEG